MKLGVILATALRPLDSPAAAAAVSSTATSLAFGETDQQGWQIWTATELSD
jgi:hypothetical protein